MDVTEGWIVLGKVVSVRQCPAREMFPVKAISMHVLFATLRLKSISVTGSFRIRSLQDKLRI